MGVRSVKIVFNKFLPDFFRTAAFGKMLQIPALLRESRREKKGEKEN